jgi:RHS repeat-associated protein
MTRDAVGNLYSYDAENHQTQYFESNNTTTPNATYFYDGDGRRVKKIVKVQSGQQTVDETTLFVYDGGGALVAEYTQNAPANTNPQTVYLTADTLGSPRINTNEKGQVVARHDYLPFGEEINAGVGGRTTNQSYPQPLAEMADGVRNKFTSKERDYETNLDYFNARYYSSIQGRFTGVDLAGPDLANPQTLNKYQYCLNNPLRHIDRNGLYEEDVHRYLTYVLALAAGFNSFSAKAIAAADQGVDDNPKTSPMGMSPFGEPVEIRRLYHFTTDERRAEMWKKFEDTGSLKDLGMFFHAQQDSFSHAGYGPRLGHAKDGHDPDKTYKDPTKADTMAADTFNKMQAALGALLTKGGEKINYQAIDWSKIYPLIYEFNRATTPEEKQKIINQMEVLIQRDHKEQDKRREEERKRQEEQKKNKQKRRG